MQHAVHAGCAGNAYVICQREPALEGAIRDAAMQVGALVALVRLPGRNDQRILANLDRQLIVRESGDGNGDPPRFIPDLLDVVRRVGRCRLAVSQEPVHHVGNLVEADGSTVQGCKIQPTHLVILL